MQSQPLLLPLLYAYIIVIAKAYLNIILYPSNNAIISLPPVTDMEVDAKTTSACISGTVTTLLYYICPANLTNLRQVFC